MFQIAMILNLPKNIQHLDYMDSKPVNLAHISLLINAIIIINID